MRSLRAAAVAACSASLGAFALGCADGQSSYESVWVAPAALEELAGPSFFDAPWPSDLRLEAGSPRLDGYHNPRGQPILIEYIDAMRGVLKGFSPAAAGYLRFTGPIDPETLPADPAASMSPLSSVQLIDIDPASPEHLQRRPVSLHWREQAGVYWLPNTLAFMPAMGAPLRPRTRYALVVTGALEGEDGGTVGVSSELREALGLADAGERTRAARDALAPSLSEIEAAGIAPDSIVHLTVFTTDDPTAELFALRDHLVSQVPAPHFRPAEWSLNAETIYYDEYLGAYGPSPNYQFGRIPFTSNGDGGDFRFEDGVPAVEGLYDLRFSLSVPNAALCPMPPEGYPIVLYAHGTSGNWRSYVNDGTARALARQCLAGMGVDQIFHGERWGAPADPAQTAILFFNFQNVVAARGNTRQSALDEVQRARLFTESGAAVPAEVSVTGEEIRFDPTRVMFYGHSQGGLNGPLYLAVDDSARGAVLSGSSAMIAITLLEKTEPSPSVAAAVKSVFLGLSADEGEELNELHPAISLAQSIVDVVDPLHYAPRIIGAPREGFAPKSIYMTEGVNPDGTGDSYAPPRGIEVHALSMGLPLQSPAQRPLPDGRWLGQPSVEIPEEGLPGNLAGGQASGVLAQWAVVPGSDGHFVVFDVPAATAQAAAFLRNLADEPAGRVPAP